MSEEILKEGAIVQFVRNGAGYHRSFIHQGVFVSKDVNYTTFRVHGQLCTIPNDQYTLVTDETLGVSEGLKCIANLDLTWVDNSGILELMEVLYTKWKNQSRTCHD